jgi:hypothetical protein
MDLPYTTIHAQKYRMAVLEVDASPEDIREGDTLHKIVRL